MKSASLCYLFTLIDCWCASEFQKSVRQRRIAPPRHESPYPNEYRSAEKKANKKEGYILSRRGAIPARNGAPANYLPGLRLVAGCFIARLRPVFCGPYCLLCTRGLIGSCRVRTLRRRARRGCDRDDENQECRNGQRDAMNPLHIRIRHQGSNRRL
jgi:hypothetical protein